MAIQKDECNETTIYLHYGKSMKTLSDFDWMATPASQVRHDGNLYLIKVISRCVDTYELDPGMTKYGVRG